MVSALGVTALALCCCRPVLAYIDPGTGGVVFSGLAPIVGIIGVVVIGAMGLARAYVVRAGSVAWRYRYVALLLLLGIVFGVVAFLLTNAREAQGHEGGSSAAPGRAGLLWPGPPGRHRGEACA
jgi:hypothetical protein